jgi:diguanylate cyclase
MPVQNSSIPQHKLTKARAAREWLAAYAGAQVKPLALLLIGIKDLKQINERLGRAGGDAVIRKAGAKIRTFADSFVNDVELIARMPGRELMLAIGGENDVKRLEVIARKLLEVLSADLGQEGEPLHISARIGIAVSEPDENGIDLLHRAGQSLAQAYGRKGKRFAFAAAWSKTGAGSDLILDADLRVAIENRQISIMLQPQWQRVVWLALRHSHAGITETSAK